MFIAWGGQRPFYHLLMTPFGVFRLSGCATGCLACVPRNTNCAANAARWEQPPPAPLRPRLNNVIHQLIFISESQPHARHPRLPLGWDVTDGLNVTSALSVCVSVFLGAVVYGPFHVCASDVSATSVSLTQAPPPAALVLTCSGGSRSI